MVSALELTRRLVAFNTVNPPGDEHECARYLGGCLEALGLEVSYADFAARRTTLVARLACTGGRAPICFTGHTDVVPLGAEPWSVDPFAGEVSNGRVYGRGTCDMKAGLAAMVAATERLAREGRRRAGLLLVFTAGEETFGDGARCVTAEPGLLGQAGALVVGEPSGNRPLVAHKGCIRYALKTRGVTAHASMPEKGDNAIFKAAEAVLRLRSFEFGVEAHDVLGRPTLNVGTIAGGLNINSVPDLATIAIDIRTIAGQTEPAIRAALQRAVGDGVEIEKLEEGPSVASDPRDPWLQEVFEVVDAVTARRSAVEAAPFFTDAAYLKPGLGEPPAVILGPGDTDIAHKTDEYCDIVKIEQAVEIYWRLLQRWCL